MKRTGAAFLLLPFQVWGVCYPYYESEEVVDLYDAVVLIAAGCICVRNICDWQVVDTDYEWVVDHAVTGLEANLGLERVLTDCAYHL